MVNREVATTAVAIADDDMAPGTTFQLLRARRPRETPRGEGLPESADGASAILAGVNADDLQLLEAVGTESVIPAGRVLIERGHPGVGVYVIVEGRVIVEAPEGTRELGPGTLVGERALVSPDGVRTARVRTATEVRVLTVGRIEFEGLCANDPGLAERLRS
jgi:CRP-like cAMP-binding protein